MKKTIKFLLVIVLTSFLNTASAQAPGNFNYQAVIRDNAGVALAAGTNVTLRFRIFNNSIGNGSAIYQEDISSMTDSFGVVNMVIGKNPSLGSLNASIDWASGPYYVDILNNGTSIYNGGNLAQLASVPYALYANKSDTASYALTTSQTTYAAGTGIRVSGDTIYNTSPDKVVTISGNGVTIVGTYPNFTITAIDPTPVGTIAAYGGLTAPSGWAMCDGSSNPITGTYANLFSVIGNAYGGNGTSTFNLPDFRGVFLRGAQMSLATGGDPDVNSRSVNGSNATTAPGSSQVDALASHNHTQNAHAHAISDPGHTHIMLTANAAGGGGGGTLLNGSGSTATQASTTGITINSATATNNPTGGLETRPKNVYVNYIIKY